MIPSTPRRAGPLNGNGTATSFPFSFKVYATGDVAVVRANTTTATETLLTEGVDYSVTLNADQVNNPGGTITYPISGSPLASGFSLTVYGDTDYTQTLSLVGVSKFDPAAIEKALDRVVMQTQQLLEQLSRTLTLAVSSGAATNLTLPAPLANNLIGWNAVANGLQNVDASTLATLVAYGTAMRDYFTGDGVTKDFTLSANPGALGNVDVDIGGVTQNGQTDFTWTGGTTLSFTTAPPVGVKIQVRYLQALPVGMVGAASVGTTQLIDANVTTVKLADAAVTTAKIADAAVTTAKIADANVTFAKLSPDALASLAALITPPGSVMDFAGETAPAGWLECDGSSLLRASYPALFAAIGTLHGAADGAHFNLPDHRGKFKRGWAHGTSNDPDAATRTAAATGGATGDHVGSAQGWQIQSHWHYFYSSETSIDGSAPDVERWTGYKASAYVTSSTGGNQTNPINAAVMSIIKT